MSSHSCVYGIFHDGGDELTQTSLSEAGRPILIWDGWKREYGKVSDWIDRRKGYIRPFNYCPYCGIKLNWREFKAYAKQLDDERNKETQP
jgi:hypothetical protein